jgi:hypothetical protein
MHTVRDSARDGRAEAVGAAAGVRYQRDGWLRSRNRKRWRPSMNGNLRFRQRRRAPAQMLQPCIGPNPHQQHAVRLQPLARFPFASLPLEGRACSFQILTEPHSLTDQPHPQAPPMRPYPSRPSPVVQHAPWNSSIWSILEKNLHSLAHFDRICTASGFWADEFRDATGGGGNVFTFSGPRLPPDRPPHQASASQYQAPPRSITDASPHLTSPRPRYRSQMRR